MSELSSPPITLAVLELGHRACAIIPQVAVIKDNKSASTNIQRKLRPYISRKYKMESLNKAPRHHPNNYYYSNPLQLYVNYTKFIGNESAHTVCPSPKQLSYCRRCQLMCNCLLLLLLLARKSEKSEEELNVPRFIKEREGGGY
jgi:hypothetical protein